MPNARTATIDEFSTYLFIYLSCFCSHCICCFSYSRYSLLTRVCFHSPLSTTTMLTRLLSRALVPTWRPSLQVQPEQPKRDQTMAMAIVTHRQQHSSRTQTGISNSHLASSTTSTHTTMIVVLINSFVLLVAS